MEELSKIVDELRAIGCTVSGSATKPQKTECNAEDPAPGPELQEFEESIGQPPSPSPGGLIRADFLCYANEGPLGGFIPADNVLSWEPSGILQDSSFTKRCSFGEVKTVKVRFKYVNEDAFRHVVGTVDQFADAWRLARCAQDEHPKRPGFFGKIIARLRGRS